MNTRYDIIVREHLPPGWSAVLDGMEVVSQPDGTTRITGELPDQAALFGLLLRLRDLGLTLVSLNSTQAEKDPPCQRMS
jgi:hypothetical protein